MAVRDLRPITELTLGRQGEITANLNTTIRQDPPSLGERLYLLYQRSRFAGGTWKTP
jgi:hypothetical protein